MKLDTAISEQISRVLEENETTPVQNSPNSELKNILQAFIAVINAYLRRISGEVPEPKNNNRSSNFFGSTG